MKTHMTRFPFPEIVSVDVEGDPDYVTNGLGLLPGMHWDEEAKFLVVHWHEGRARVSVVDFQLVDTEGEFMWKAEHGGEFTMRPMTVDLWRERFVPRGWRDVTLIAELAAFLRAAL